MSFTLDELTDTQFEAFCFDTLKSLGFVNLNWRKGTGLDSSPADQGRDIQGELLRKDIDGSERHEKWFVECKHYIRGVPPEKIQGAISWAAAGRPDVLLIVASNFLSNPTKNYLEQFQRENRPPYRIKVWERTELDNLTAGRNDLRKKYGLPTGVPFLSVLNSYHAIYSLKPHLNTIEYLLELMDSLDSSKRDEAFAMTYFDIVNPRFRAPDSADEKIGSLMLDAVNYSSFRARLLAMKADSSPSFVHKLVSSTLALVFMNADQTALESTQAAQRELIEYLSTSIDEEQDGPKRTASARLLERVARTEKELPERLQHGFELYTYICDELVSKLLAERVRLGRSSEATLSGSDEG